MGEFDELLIEGMCFAERTHPMIVPVRARSWMENVRKVFDEIPPTLKRDLCLKKERKDCFPQELVEELSAVMMVVMTLAAAGDAKGAMLLAVSGV